MPTRERDKHTPPPRDRDEPARWPSEWGPPSESNVQAVLDGLLANTKLDLTARSRAAAPRSPHRSVLPSREAARTAAAAPAVAKASAPPAATKAPPEPPANPPAAPAAPAQAKAVVAKPRKIDPAPAPRPPAAWPEPLDLGRPRRPSWVLPVACVVVVGLSGAFLSYGSGLDWSLESLRERLPSLARSPGSAAPPTVEPPPPAAEATATGAPPIAEATVVSTRQLPADRQSEEQPSAPAVASAGVGDDPNGLAARTGEIARLVTEYELDQAERLIGEVLAVDPANVTALVARGRVRLLRNDDVGAMTAFNAVLSAHPGTVAARLGRMEALIGLGQAALVSDLIEEIAVEEQDTPPAIHDLRAHANAQLGELERAKANCADLADVTQAGFVGNWCLGLVLREAGDAAASAAAFGEAIAAAPAAFVVNRQRYLRFRGHYRGEIDGLAGEAFTAALGACARDKEC